MRGKVFFSHEKLFRGRFCVDIPEQWVLNRITWRNPKLCSETANAFMHDADPRKALEVSAEERTALWERLYGEPGFGIWLANFSDILVDEDANDLISEFMAGKIRERAIDPAIAEKLPFTAPAVSTATLDNGLPIYVYTRNDLPKVEVALMIKRGDLGESEQTAGLSYMTTAAVDEGTTSRTALEIQSELQNLGAGLGTRGDKFGSVVSLSSLKRTLPDAFEILADVTLNPTFPESELELVRELRPASQDDAESCIQRVHPRRQPAQADRIAGKPFAPSQYGRW